MDLSTETPEALAWQHDRNARAERFLAELPAREALRRSITAKLADTRLAPLRRRGDRWFQQVVVEPHAEQPVLVVRGAPPGPPPGLPHPQQQSAHRPSRCGSRRHA